MGEKRGGYGGGWVGICAQVARCKKKRGLVRLLLAWLGAWEGRSEKLRLSVWLKKRGVICVF